MTHPKTFSFFYITSHLVYFSRNKNVFAFAHKRIMEEKQKKKTKLLVDFVISKHIV